MSERSRVAVQFPMGLASGLPYLLSGGTLAVWLENSGIDIATIGVFALVALPYNLKFLWAPVLDRYRPPWLSRRRGWILLFQLAVAVTVLSMSLLDPRSAIAVVAVVASVLVVLSASQDIVVDAYRTDVLSADERGRGTSYYVVGYRIALIIAGSGALVLSDLAGWQWTFVALAGLVALASVATLRAPPVPAAAGPASLRNSVVAPLAEIFRRRQIWLLLGFVALFRIGDSMVSHLVGPFLLETGFSNTEIGLVQKGIGMASTIVGVLGGGMLLDRISMRRAVLMFGAAQALANVGYMVLPQTGGSTSALVAAVFCDNLCNGLGIAVFVAFIMSRCDKRFSATQYALFTSLSTVLGRLLTAVAGYGVAAVGWTGFFAVTILLAIPALGIAWYAPAIFLELPSRVRGD